MADEYWIMLAIVLILFVLTQRLVRLDERDQRNREECATWGHTIAETGRCTVCDRHQDGTLAEIEEGR